MALSTRAKLAGLGGALALGLLGATGVAYATDGAATPQYVTSVDDGTTQQAPADGSRPEGGREDCPEKGGGSGGSGEGGTSPSPSPSQSGSTDGAADA